jgi:hypothetical protein
MRPQCALILRDAAKTPLLRMRENSGLADTMTIGGNIAFRLSPARGEREPALRVSRIEKYQD